MAERFNFRKGHILKHRWVAGQIYLEVWYYGARLLYQVPLKDYMINIINEDFEIRERNTY